MRNTADVTGGKPNAVLLQSMSGESAINPLVVFYDIHLGKRGAILLFCPDTTRDKIINNKLVNKLVFGTKKLSNDHRGQSLDG
jgi:hypothetical protein